MDDETWVSRAGALVEAGVGDELMALDIDRGLCFGFNATAAALLRLIETPQTLGALCDAMIARHRVDRETCRNDVVRVLDDLAERALVTLSPPR